MKPPPGYWVVCLQSSASSGCCTSGDRVLQMVQISGLVDKSCWFCERILAGSSGVLVLGELAVRTEYAAPL